jgi:CheY-like chemotaxis protein
LRRTVSAQSDDRPIGIALTVNAGEIDHQQAMAAGFQRHIAKPVEPENLVRAIITLLEDGRLN